MAMVRLSMDHVVMTRIYIRDINIQSGSRKRLILKCLEIRGCYHGRRFWLIHPDMPVGDRGGSLHALLNIRSYQRCNDVAITIICHRPGQIWYWKAHSSKLTIMLIQDFRTGHLVMPDVGRKVFRVIVTGPLNWLQPV